MQPPSTSSVALAFIGLFCVLTAKLAGQKRRLNSIRVMRRAKDKKYSQDEEEEENEKFRRQTLRAAATVVNNAESTVRAARVANASARAVVHSGPKELVPAIDKAVKRSFHSGTSGSVGGTLGKAGAVAKELSTYAPAISQLHAMDQLCRAKTNNERTKIFAEEPALVIGSAIGKNVALLLG